MAVKTNREILTAGKNYKQKAAKKFGADEVTFDKDSRLEYLTGFHKRKLDRQKKAKDYIQEQERKIKLEERAKLRENKKKVLEKQLADFKQAMKDVGDYVGEEEEENEEADEDKDAEEQVDGEAEEWTGFSDDQEDKNDEQENDDSSSVKPILKKYVQTYLDDTTVDIEPLEPNDNFEYLAELNNVKLQKSEQILDQSIERAKKYAKFLGVEDKPKSKKNKKFRYLTKNERRQNQRKADNNKRRK